MPLSHSILLSLVQGATEFIPVSSSGHLVLVPWLLGWEKPGVLFDSIVHWGTLAAVLLVFWQDIVRLVRAFWRSVRLRSIPDAEAKTAWLIIVATIPAAALGAAFEGFFEDLFDSPRAVAALLLVTGVVLVAAERLYRRGVGARMGGKPALTGVASAAFRQPDPPCRDRKTMRDQSWADALLVGLAQAVAIAPGISRSGATISMGMALGVQREQAARFSFLLAIPVILGAGAVKIADIGAEAHPSAGALALGAAGAAISGYVAIRLLLPFLRRGNLYLFAVYCWLLGISSLIYASVK
jgi:undecaprenyl-diphosphatase